MIEHQMHRWAITSCDPKSIFLDFFEHAAEKLKEECATENDIQINPGRFYPCVG